MLYVDNPVGAGFSYTGDDLGYSTDEMDVARNLYAFLVQFFELFPEYQHNDFYVTGESFAGHYVPAVSYVIHLNNPGAKVKINLKGLAIGNGLVDPLNQLFYSEYLYQLGFFDGNFIQLYYDTILPPHFSHTNTIMLNTSKKNFKNISCCG